MLVDTVTIIPLAVCLISMVILGVLAIDTATKLEHTELKLRRLKLFAEDMVDRDILRQLELDPQSQDLDRQALTIRLLQDQIEELQLDNLALAKSLAHAQAALTQQPD